MNLDTSNDTSSLITNKSSEETLPNIEQEPPQKKMTYVQDNYHFIEIIFGLLGLVSFLPWNVLITASDCWLYKFRDVTKPYVPGVSPKTELQIFFNSYLSMASNIPGFLVMLLMIIFGHKVKSTIRNVISLTSMTLLLIIITILVKTNSDKWQQQFFYLIMGLAIFMSLATNTFLSSLTGIISSFPDKCMQSMLIGQSCSGILVAIFQIISLNLQGDAQTKATYYFIISTVIMTLTFAAYLFARKTDFYRHYRKRGISTVNLTTLANEATSHGADILLILKKTWPHLFSQIVTLFASFSTIPSLVTLVLPSHPNSSPWTGHLFTPVCSFLLFNYGDLTGKLTSKWLVLPSNKPITLAILSFFRSFLVFLLMLCNVQPRQYLPVVFESEYYYIAFIAVFAFSQGYILSISLVQAAQLVPPSLLERFGFILTLSVGIAVMLGSIFSNILLRLI